MRAADRPVLALALALAVGTAGGAGARTGDGAPPGRPTPASPGDGSGTSSSAVAAPSGVSRAPGGAGGPSRTPPPFGAGERADYDVAFGVVHAGIARIVTGEPSGDVWPIVLLARSEGLFGVLGIRESLTSFLDVATGLPRGSVLVASELGDRHEDRTTFDRSAGTATLHVRRKDRVEQRVLPVAPGAHDLPTAVSRLRSELREPGQRVEIPVLSGAQAFVLAAEVEAREAIEVPAGRHAALRVRVRLGFRGPFAGGDVRMWLSDDARRVPLAVEAPFAIGSIRARLTAYRPGTVP
jgi:hypothetical protein